MDEEMNQRTNPVLIYQSAIGSQKPFTIRTPATPCPFCDHTQLPPIQAQDGDILLVPNKYPILKDTDPYVLIETSECESELSQYSDDRLLRVFQMAFSLWRQMLANPRYRSVLFMKNHGPFSGGSLRHPHMQLIGLYHVDALTHIHREDFLGPVMEQSPGVTLTVSDHPRVGFFELNAILTNEEAFPQFCFLIRKAVCFILHSFHHGSIDSYNLFFYQIDGVTYCKIMPRTATTPIYIGYGIGQVSDDLHSIIQDFSQWGISSKR